MVGGVHEAGGGGGRGSVGDPWHESCSTLAVNPETIEPPAPVQRIVKVRRDYNSNCTQNKNRMRAPHPAGSCRYRRTSWAGNCAGVQTRRSCCAPTMCRNASSVSALPSPTLIA
jgi:hypothetical protein